MIVKFLFGYSGRETAMKTHDVDDVVDIPTAAALELIRLGVVEEVEEEIVVRFTSQQEVIHITSDLLIEDTPAPKRRGKGKVSNGENS